MRRSIAIARLLLALCVPLALAAAASLGAAPRPDLAAGGNCVFLPMVSRGGGAQAPRSGGLAAAPGCRAPAPAPEPSPTATAAPGPAQLTGTLRLRPAYAQIATLRNPTRYTIVLDTSSSMSANFNGQCNNTGAVVQCAAGPPDLGPVTVAGSGASYNWSTLSERRIYVAKKAIERLIGLTNMPGNTGYTPSQPPDQVGLVWFNQGAPAANATAYSSDRAALISAVTNANKTNGDPYLTSGGSNAAAGLYRAGLLIDAAPQSVGFNGQTYDYQDQVLFVTDGVASSFLDPSKADLDGGASNNSTYPAGSYCRNLANVTESAACQTTEIGGTYNGWDRPITQMVVTSYLLKARASNPANVFVIALSNLPATGLADGVASNPSMFFRLESLVTNPDGTTNVDTVIDAIQAPIVGEACTPVLGEVTDAIDAAHLSAQQPVGQVQMTNAAGDSFTVDVQRDPTSGALAYGFTGLPAGDYQLQAYLWYKGDDGATRQYSKIQLADQVVTQITVTATGQSQQLAPMLLRLNAIDVCAQN